VTGAERVSVNSSSNSDNKEGSAPCPTGKKVVGGGVDVNAPDTGKVFVTRSRPANDLKSWEGRAEEATTYTENWSITVYAVCIISP
jgi:hypothetical protein